MKTIFVLKNHFTHDSRVLKEGVSLVNNGFEVVIRCLWDEGLPKEEFVKGVKVERVLKSDRSRTKSLVVKLWMAFLFTFRSTRGAADFDYIHCHDVVALPAGVYAKLFKNKKIKLIYDAHEYQCEQNGRSAFVKKLIWFVEKYLIGFVDKIITVSDSIASEYVRLYDISRPELVLNCPPYSKVEESVNLKKIIGVDEDMMLFLYQGGLMKGRGIEIILDVFKSISDLNVGVLFLGYGPLEEKIKQHSDKYSKIYFHEAVSPEILINYTAGADIGLCLIEDTCLSYRYCLPNKFFEYAMAGLPSVVSDLPELVKVSKELNTSYILESHSPDHLLSVINQALASPPKDNISSNFKKKYSWESQEKSLLSCYS